MKDKHEPKAMQRFRYWRIAATLITVAGLPLVVIGMVIYACRTQWRHYTSPAFGPSKISLYYELPDLWKPDKTPLFGYKDIIIKCNPNAPRGPSKWFYENILHHKMNDWKQDRLTISFGLRDSADGNIKTLRQELSVVHGAYDRLRTITERQYPLGPSLEIQAPIPILERTRDFITFLPENTTAQKDYYCCLFLDMPSKDFKLLHPILLEVARRIHITSAP